MQLEHTFTIPVTVDQAWNVLLDIERIAPCMPGASLESVDGDDFTGSVKVKLGPINLTYKGKASFVEKDETAHRAVIDARGKDARGAGTASAKVTATLQAEGDNTQVDVLTHLDITGKPAQFGRGVMVDVGNKLLGQFADCLAGKLAGGGDDENSDAAASGEGSAETNAEPGPTTGAQPATTEAVGEAAAEPTARSSNGASATPAPAARPSSSTARHARLDSDDVEPINLIESAGPAIAKRLAPVLGGLLLLVLLLGVLRRRFR